MIIMGDKGDFVCCHNPSLESWEGLTELGGKFYCYGTPLFSRKDLPFPIGKCYCGEFFYNNNKEMPDEIKELMEKIYEEIDNMTWPDINSETDARKLFTADVIYFLVLIAILIAIVKNPEWCKDGCLRKEAEYIINNPDMYKKHSFANYYYQFFILVAISPLFAKNSYIIDDFGRTVADLRAIVINILISVDSEYASQEGIRVLIPKDIKPLSQEELRRLFGEITHTYRQYKNRQR